MNNVFSKDAGMYPERVLSGALTYPLHFLTNLLSDMASCSSREQVFALLPRLLEHAGATRISLWQQQTNEFAELAHEASAPQTTEVGNKHEGQDRDDPKAAPVATNETVLASKIILPLLEGNEVVATLKLQRDFSFDAADYKTMSWFTQSVSCHLTTLAERIKTTMSTHLSRRLATLQDSRAIAEVALELLLEDLKLEHGALLVQQGGRFHTLAQRGQLFEHPSDASLPLLRPWLEHLYKQGQPFYSQSNIPAEEHSANKHSADNRIASFMVYPFSNTMPARFILILADGQPRCWLESEKEVLVLACQLLSLALCSSESRSRLETLLRLQQDSLVESETYLLGEIVAAALKTVPGAEAGSLLLKKGKKFHFRAALGYDLNALKAFSFRESEMLHWQQPEASGPNSSEPRIFSKKDGEQKEILAGPALPPAFREAGRVDDIQSNLYFPIMYHGQVLAVLNLDNFHDPDAFAADSLEAARMFGPPVAVLLRERRYRYLLERDALTDPLTNLANRRAFDQALNRESTHAQADQAAFSLLMLDLGNFKTINDTLGHAQGDAVLIEVAKTLRKVTRPGDLLFRWGGDEYAVLLPNTPYEGAVIAARRCARAINRISKYTLPVHVHIGVATYPSCADSIQTLLHLADERLYEAKEKNITVCLSEAFISSQQKAHA